jgi:hypothetical protein
MKNIFSLLVGLSIFCSPYLNADAAETKIGEVYLPHLMDSASKFSQAFEKIKPNSGMMVAAFVMGVSFIPQLKEVNITQDLRGSLFFNKEKGTQWVLFAPAKKNDRNAVENEISFNEKQKVYSRTVGDRILVGSDSEIMQLKTDILFSDFEKNEKSSADIMVTVFPKGIIDAFPHLTDGISNEYISGDTEINSDFLKKFAAQCRKVNISIEALDDGTVELKSDILPEKGSRFAEVLKEQFDKKTPITFGNLIKLFNDSAGAEINAVSLQQLFNIKGKGSVSRFIEDCIPVLSGEFTGNSNSLQIVLKLKPVQSPE